MSFLVKANNMNSPIFGIWTGKYFLPTWKVVTTHRFGFNKAEKTVISARRLARMVQTVVDDFCFSNVWARLGEETAYLPGEVSM